MELYSYVIKHDSGFAANPFWGYCTLADCKPAIRRTAKVGDWIVSARYREAYRGKIFFALEKFVNRNSGMKILTPPG